MDNSYAFRFPLALNVCVNRVDTQDPDVCDQTWTTLAPFIYRTHIAPPNQDLIDRLLVRPSTGFAGVWEVQIPVGICTDFASVPRPLWVIIPKTGRWSFAAVLHDFLYDYQLGSREWADLLLREAADDSYVGWRREALYYGVRVGGEKAWNAGKYRKTQAFTHHGYPLYAPLA